MGHTHSETQMPSKTPEQAGLKLGKELGHGAFGTVMLATDKTGSKKCVKKMKKADMQGAGLEELAEEFEMMHSMSNSNIAKTYELFQDALFYYIVNEPYFGGDLSKLRKKAAAQNIQLTDEYWQKIFRQCFQGLGYLHDQGMMHCDIKEENVMVKTEDYGDPQVVIIDFGLAQHDADEKAQICGTPGYIPPETWQSMKWYPKGDVFSMGVTMLQLVIDQVPEATEGPNPQAIKVGIFSGASIDEVKANTNLVQPPLNRIPTSMRGFQIFVSKCLQKMRHGRPTSLQALSDPWLAGVSPSVQTTYPSLSMSNQTLTQTQQTIIQPTTVYATNTLSEDIVTEPPPSSFRSLESLRQPSAGPTPLGSGRGLTPPRSSGRAGMGQPVRLGDLPMSQPSTTVRPSTPPVIRPASTTVRPPMSQPMQKIEWGGPKEVKEREPSVFDCCSSRK